MNHSDMDDLYELYLMGVLESAEAAEISVHLSSGCDHCIKRLQESSALLASLAASVELKSPPPELKERVLAMVGRKRVVSVAPANTKRWPLAFLFASAAAITFLLWGLSERGSLGDMLVQLDQVTQQRNDLRAALAILSEADTRTVKFGDTETEPHGRVFISRSGGVVFVGSQLPTLASGKTFQLWLVPGKGNPQSAGLFATNAKGISVNVLARSINPAQFTAVAVSIEPTSGSAQPSGKPILIVPLA